MCQVSDLRIDSRIGGDFRSAALKSGTMVAVMARPKSSDICRILPTACVANVLIR
jgi:hypothetical protein